MYWLVISPLHQFTEDIRGLVGRNPDHTLSLGVIVGTLPKILLALIQTVTLFTNFQVKILTNKYTYLFQ